MPDKKGFASVLVPMVQFPALLLMPTPLRGHAIEEGTVIRRSSLSTYIASIQSCRRSYAAAIQWTLNRPYLKVKARYDAELRDHHIPLDTIEFLISYKATTMDWITHVLCRDLPGAAVTSIRPGAAPAATIFRIQRTRKRSGPAADRFLHSNSNRQESMPTCAKWLRSTGRYSSNDQPSRQLWISSILSKRREHLFA
ncbi:MAG: hypothetical protein ACI915_004860 [Gammaproteobacteria bacterium]|jgi:hypothetical protein